MIDIDMKRAVDVLNEIDDCIQSCYCHRFAKIRGVDGVILVRPADVLNNPADIVYNIIILSDNMSSPERSIAFLEYLLNDYITFKNQYEHTNLKHDINVIYTHTSNIKGVIKEGDTKVKAFISMKKYGTAASDEIVRGSNNIFACNNDVYFADFEQNGLA